MMDGKKTETTPRPRTKPAEVRLEELMVAAQALFMDKGVEATTISEIVDRAGVAKGTFYHYFTSKTEMLEALARRYTDEFLAAVQQALDACAADDWQRRLQTWIEVGMDTYVQTYRTHDIVYTNHHQHNRDNPEKNAILDQLLAILAGGEADQLWQLEQPRATALLIYAGVFGACDDLIAGACKDHERFRQAVVASCLRMVGLTVR